MELLLVLIITLIFIILISGSSSNQTKKIVEKPNFNNSIAIKKLEVADTISSIGNIKEWMEKYPNNLQITYKIDDDKGKISIYGNNEDRYKLGHIDDEAAKELIILNEKFIVKLVSTSKIKDIKDEKGEIISNYAVIKYDILTL